MTFASLRLCVRIFVHAKTPSTLFVSVTVGDEGVVGVSSLLTHRSLYLRGSGPCSARTSRANSRSARRG
jgi:hypothetical protein